MIRVIAQERGYILIKNIARENQGIDQKTPFHNGKKAL
jgi:hypothetical protein